MAVTNQSASLYPPACAHVTHDWLDRVDHSHTLPNPRPSTITITQVEAVVGRMRIRSCDNRRC